MLDAVLVADTVEDVANVPDVLLAQAGQPRPESIAWPGADTIIQRSMAIPSALPQQAWDRNGPAQPASDGERFELIGDLSHSVLPLNASFGHDGSSCRLAVGPVGSQLTVENHAPNASLCEEGSASGTGRVRDVCGAVR